PEPLREVASALAMLRDLHRERNRRPLADTIGRLLSATRAHAGIAIWPTGEHALANVTRLLDLARRAERNGAISFRAFVDHLADQAERGEAGGGPGRGGGTRGRRGPSRKGPKACASCPSTARKASSSRSSCSPISAQRPRVTSRCGGST